LGNLTELILILVLAIAVGALAAMVLAKAPFKRKRSRGTTLANLLSRVEQSKRALEEALDSERIPLEQVEKAARLLEHMLELLSQLKKEGRLDPLSLNSAVFVAEDIYALLQKQNVTDGSETHHCYFCSKPYKGHKALAQIKQGQIKADVTTCETCMNKIKSGGKAKVLHFTDSDGKAVHWTEYKDFLPNSSYWTINMDQPTPKKPAHLVIVKDEDNHI
jgi:hypothetical protein